MDTQTLGQPHQQHRCFYPNQSTYYSNNSPGRKVKHHTHTSTGTRVVAYGLWVYGLFHIFSFHINFSLSCNFVLCFFIFGSLKKYIYI